MIGLVLSILKAVRDGTGLGNAALVEAVKVFNGVFSVPKALLL